MMNHTSRRSFLRTASMGVAAGIVSPAAFGVTEAFERAGKSRLRLGLAAYSFGKYFPTMKGVANPKQKDGRQMDMKGFVRYCAEQRCGGAELTSYYFDPEVSDAYLAECRHLAHTCGVEISGTAVGNNFSYPKGSAEREEQMAYVKTWIDRAVLLGAPHIRVFAGKHPKGVSEEDAERNASEALEEAGAYAGSKGIFLGIENHDSIITAARLLRIVKAVKSPWVGVNLDTGNFRAEDPYAEMAASAPYAVNVQVKHSLVVGKERKAADLPRIAKILREANYQGYVVLEYEEENDPYVAVPKLLEQLGAVCD